jgi:hypothetical protein
MEWTGGNTFWLLHHLEQSGFRQLIRQLVMEQGVLYVGKSAGAIVTGQTIATALWKGWDDPTVVPDLDTSNPEVGRRSLISYVWQERQALWFKAKRIGGLRCRAVGSAHKPRCAERGPCTHRPSWVWRAHVRSCRGWGCYLAACFRTLHRGGKGWYSGGAATCRTTWCASVTARASFGWTVYASELLTSPGRTMCSNYTPYTCYCAELSILVATSLHPW